MFDVVVSISNFEHDGLGRCGGVCGGVCVGGVCVCLCLNSCVYICKYLLSHTRALACDDTHFCCCRYGDPIDPDGDMRAMKEMKVLCSDITITRHPSHVTIRPS